MMSQQLSKATSKAAYKAGSMSAAKISSARNQKGSVLAEFGPALVILFFCLFFPMIDLLALGMSYCSCLSLNEVQVREAALEPQKLAQSADGAVIKTIPDQWVKSGLGQLANMQSNPQTTLSYHQGESTGNGVHDKYVTVTTHVLVRPLLTLPTGFKLPGLSAPVDFVVGTERLVENPSGV